MSIELLSRQNLWWEDPTGIERDPYICEFNESSIKWFPPFLSRINLKNDLVYIIMGPRQVGKSTAFKLLIKQLLQADKISPRRILYLNCDEVAPPAPQALAELITGYLDWSREIAGRKYIFIDEATYLKDWERGIKILADRGLFSNTTVFITGSHLMGLRRGGERLPGRRGESSKQDIFLYPLSFREYLMLSQKKYQIPAFPGWDHEKLSAVSNEIAVHLGTQIYTFFQSYMRSGGILRAIREYKNQSSIRSEIYKLYRDAFVGDLVRMGRRESYLRELIQWIINQRENPFEWSDPARETYLGTHPTVREYIEDVEASFVWSVFYKLKQIGKPFRAPRSPKRVYFNDTFIFHALRAWVLGYQNPYRAHEEFLNDPSNLGYLVESLTASHLRRRFCENVYYWRNGGEIDFIVFEEGKKQALIEVKYQQTINSEDSRVLNKWGKGIILTKNKLAQIEGNLYVPTPYFLSMLD